MMQETPAYQTIPGISKRALASADITQVSELKSFVDDTVGTLLKQGHLPGASIAVVKNDRLIFSAGYGFANLQERIKVDPGQTLFRVGSISKLLTFTAVMLEVQNGRLELDADVNTYLDFRVPDNFEPPITLRHLMTHTAGFEDNALGHMVSRQHDELLPLNEALKRYMPARVRPPCDNVLSGSCWSYSNWGAALAGHIVALNSGLSFETYIQRCILDPLRMQHSSFHEPAHGSLATLQAMGYVPNEHSTDGFEPLADIYSGSFAPASCFSTTAEDMGLFMLAHLHDSRSAGTALLNPSTLAKMHARAISPHASCNGSTLGFFERYINGRRLLEHGGHDLHFHAHMSLLPEERLGIFVACNCASQPETAEIIVLKLLDRFCPGELPDIPLNAQGKSVLSRYRGTYQSRQHAYSTQQKILSLHPSNNLIRVKSKQGQINVSGLDHEVWQPAAKDLFRARESEDFIVFEGPANKAARFLIGPQSFRCAERLPWHQLPWLQLALYFCFISLLLSSLMMGTGMQWWLSAVTTLVSLSVSGLLIFGYTRPLIDLACSVPRSIRMANILVWCLPAASLFSLFAIGVRYVLESAASAPRLADFMLVLGSAGLTGWLAHWNQFKKRFA